MVRRVEGDPLGKMVDRYLLSGRAAGLAPTTSRWYDLLLHGYLTWDGAPRAVAGFDAPSVVAFLAWLRDRVGPRGRRVSAETLHAHYRVLRAFATWLAHEGHTKSNVLAGLRAPRRERKVVTPLSDDDVRRLLRVCPNGTFHGERDRLILLLLLDTGLRRNELLSLGLPDLDLSARVLLVRGKGGRERRVSFGDAVADALGRFIARWQPAGVLLTSQRGRALRPAALRRILARCGARAGISGLHAHRFRHTFALRYLEAGGDVFTLQRLLGHSTLDMVQRYLRLADGHVLAAHRRHSPVDRLGGPVAGRTARGQGPVGRRQRPRGESRLTARIPRARS
ncbi:MAG: tyrosine-type recombinase/integrase [Chloroflexota bacterium]|nr:tyrosine-type recombinase/integrase [Chloroflexota bacterium]